ELIYKIAQEKKKVNDVFQNAIKEAAVDCNLNKTHNNTEGNKIDCMILPTTYKDRKHAYYPDLWEDITRYRPIKLEKITGKDKIILGEYTADNAAFSPKRFPELWKTTKDNKLEPLYLIRVEKGNAKVEMDGHIEKIYLYDKVAAENGQEALVLGFLSNNKGKLLVNWL
ncbi:MAG: hypothetical protein WD512_09380, partial [Candidatus Paceibacterota bacterium]